MADYPDTSPSYRLHDGHGEEHRAHTSRTQRASQEEAELTELAAPAPAPQWERRGSAFEDHESAIRRDRRQPRGGTGDEAQTEAAAPSPTEEQQLQRLHPDSQGPGSDEETPSSVNMNGKRKGQQQVDRAEKTSSPIMTELYTVSWLIFFSSGALSHGWDWRQSLSTLIRLSLHACSGQTWAVPLCLEHSQRTDDYSMKNGGHRI